MKTKTVTQVKVRTIAVLLRNVPEKLHREIKAAAAESGKTLRGFILDAAAEVARRKGWRQD